MILYKMLLLTYLYILYLFFIKGNIYTIFIIYIHLLSFNILFTISKSFYRFLADTDPEISLTYIGVYVFI